MRKMKQLTAIGLSSCMLLGTTNMSYAMSAESFGVNARSDKGVTITSITPVDGTILNEEMFFGMDQIM